MEVFAWVKKALEKGKRVWVLHDSTRPRDSPQKKGKKKGKKEGTRIIETEKK